MSAFSFGCGAMCSYLLVFRGVRASYFCGEGRVRARGIHFASLSCYRFSSVVYSFVCEGKGGMAGGGSRGECSICGEREVGICVFGGALGGVPDRLVWLFRSVKRWRTLASPAFLANRFASLKARY